MTLGFRPIAIEGCFEVWHMLAENRFVDLNAFFVFSNIESDDLRSNGADKVPVCKLVEMKQAG